MAIRRPRVDELSITRPGIGGGMTQDFVGGLGIAPGATPEDTLAAIRANQGPPPTLPRIPSNINIPRMTAPAVSSPQLQARANLGLEAMQRTGSVSKNMRDIKQERIAAAQPAPLTEKERIAKIETQSREVIAAGEEAGKTLREGTAQSKEAHEMAMATFAQSKAIAVEKVRAIEERITLTGQGKMVGTEENKELRRRTLQDVAKEYELKGDFAGKEAALTMLIDSYKADLQRGEVGGTTSQTIYKDNQAVSTTEAPFMKRSDAAPAPPSVPGQRSGGSGDDDGNGVPDNEMWTDPSSGTKLNMNKVVNFIAKFEKISKDAPSDPWLSEVRAQYELDKKRRQIWLSSKTQPKTTE